MNDSERVKVADVIETELDSYCPSPFNGAFAVSLMQIIDRLLADRAVPDPDADAVDRATVALSDSWDRQFSDDGGVSFRQLAADALQAVAMPEPAADAVERVATDEWRRLGGEKSNGSIRIDDYQFTDLVLHILPAVPEPDAAAGNALDAVTLAYMKGWQDGQDAAGDDLDAMLDSVHPNAAVHVWLESEPEPDVGLPHYFMARLDVNGPDTSDPHYGTGPTRYEAIKAAVTSRHAAMEAQENDDE